MTKDKDYTPSHLDPNAEPNLRHWTDDALLAFAVLLTMLAVALEHC